MFQLSTSPIQRERLIQSLKEERAGALVVFEGWIRDHNQGMSVASLEYQVYEVLAQKEGDKIIAEAMHKFNLHRVACVHRFGHLHLGDIAVWIGAIASHRDDAFKATRYIIDEIKLRLPIWKKEHYLNEKSDWVFCKDHHTHVHFQEKDYYLKQSLVADAGILKKSKVLVIGAGGLGCPALLALSTAGVGHIDIVDFDKITISNIHRQPLYTPDVVGEKKVTVAKNRLTALNPFIHIHAHDARIDATNVERWIQGQDLILDCTDNMETKYLLHDACFRHKKPLISASIYKFEGQIRTFDPQQNLGCLRCLQINTPEDSQLGNCNDYGVLGVSVATIGSLQASEALAFLLSKTNNTLHETFFFNLKKLSQLKIKNFKRDDCLCCAGLAELPTSDIEVELQNLDITAVELVDIRNEDDEFLNQYQRREKPVVIYCHRGVRSKELVKKQRQLGFSQFYSLKGGACSL